jgi:type IV pilus assembly protein PilN
VILINLLPHREAARKRRQETFYAMLGASALAGGLIAGGIYAWYAAQISGQQNRNMVLQQEIKRLEGQIKDIAALQQEIAALRARQQAVEDLQADRNMPVHLLNELVRQLPDGVYVTSVKQDGQVVEIKGIAQSNERVSELLRNLGNNSPWLTRPELIEIVAGSVALTPRDTRRVANFGMRVRLLRASEAQQAAGAAGAASAPALAASAPASAASAPKAAVASTAPEVKKP